MALYLFGNEIVSEHYSDVIMSAMASQSNVSIGCSAVCSGADQRKHQSSAALVFVMGIHRWSVGSPYMYIGPVTRKMFPFDDVIMRDRTIRIRIFCVFRNESITISSWILFRCIPLGHCMCYLYNSTLNSAVNPWPLQTWDCILTNKRDTTHKHFFLNG